MKPTASDALPRRSLRSALWWTLAFGCALVLGAAAMLEPDARGYGTHTQLGLPPCGFRVLTGLPCPGCGLTTAFAYAIRGEWLLASSANPLGMFLFVLVCATVPLSIVGALRGWSLDTLFERFFLGRWALAVAGCGVALWAARLADAL